MPNVRQKLVQVTLRGLLPLALLALVLFTTNPYRLPLVLLIVPFILIFITMYQGFHLLLKSNTQGHKKQQLNAILFAGGIVTLALLQSIRQLSARDFIIIVILVVGLSFYIRRIDL